MSQDIGVTFHDLSSNVFEFVKVRSDNDVTELRKKWMELREGANHTDGADLHVLLCNGVEIPPEGSIQTLLSPGCFVLSLQVERVKEISVQLVGRSQKSVKIKVHPQKTTGAVLSDAKQSLGIKKDREVRLLFGEEPLRLDSVLPPLESDQALLLDFKLSVLVLDGAKLLPPLVDVAGELSFSGEWSMSSSGGQQWISCFATQSATCLMQEAEPFSKQRLIETNNMRFVTEECRVGDLLDDLEILSRRTAMAILEKQITLTVENLISKESTTLLVWPSMKVGTVFTNTEDVFYKDAFLDKSKSFFEAGVGTDICLTVSKMVMVTVIDSKGECHSLQVPHGTTLAEVREQAKAFEEHCFFKVSHNGLELNCDSRLLTDLQGDGPITLRLFCLTKNVEVTYNNETRLLTDVSEVVQVEEFLEMVGEAFDEVLPADTEFHCPCGRIFSKEGPQRRVFPIRCCDNEVLHLSVTFPWDQDQTGPSAPPPPYETLGFDTTLPSAPPPAPILRGSVLPQIIRFLVSAKGNLHFKDNSGRSLLHLVAQGGCLEAIQFLIDSGANVGVARKDGVLPLHLAAQHGRLQAVQLLLRHTEADSTASDLRNALHFAAQAGHVDVVRELLRHKVAIDAATKTGFTALHFASFGGHAEVIRLLASTGCELNKPTNMGFSPLHCAAQNGHLEATVALIQSGCDINCRTGKNTSALHIAVNMNHVAVARVLVEAGLDLNCRSNNGFAPLHTAAFSGQVDAVSFLLEAGADQMARTTGGLTPLYFAVQKNKTDVVAHLTTGKFKTDVNAKNDFGHGALHAAATQNHAEAARLLLKAGADVNLLNKDGRTPLHLAAYSGHFEVAQLLIKAGADVNATSNQGSTPLHLAVQCNMLEVARLLLGAGCDVNKCSFKGFAPLHQAVQRKNTDFVRLLIEHGADVKLPTETTGITPLHAVAECDVAAIAELLLRAGADPNALTNGLSSPLHFAARNGSATVARLLIEAGAGLETTTQDLQCRPLHYAAKEGHAEVMKVLTDAKADLEARSKEGLTALHMAAAEGHTEVVKALLQAGADSAAKTDEGRTAEDLATAKGHQTVAKALRGGGPLSFLRSLKK